MQVQSAKISIDIPVYFKTLKTDFLKLKSGWRLNKKGVP